MLLFTFLLFSTRSASTTSAASWWCVVVPGLDPWLFVTQVTPTRQMSVLLGRDAWPIQMIGCTCPGYSSVLVLNYGFSFSTLIFIEIALVVPLPFLPARRRHYPVIRRGYWELWFPLWTASLFAFSSVIFPSPPACGSWTWWEGTLGRSGPRVALV